MPQKPSTVQSLPEPALTISNFRGLHHQQATISNINLTMAKKNKSKGAKKSKGKDIGVTLDSHQQDANSNVSAVEENPPGAIVYYELDDDGNSIDAATRSRRFREKARAAEANECWQANECRQPQVAVKANIPNFYDSDSDDSGPLRKEVVPAPPPIKNKLMAAINMLLAILLKILLSFAAIFLAVVLAFVLYFLLFAKSADDEL